MPKAKTVDVAPEAAVLVSACLLGVRCRYDASTNPSEEIDRLTSGMRVIPICPEEMGGMGTPRPAAQLHGGSARDVLRGRAKAVNCRGSDVTAAFLTGAAEAEQLAKEHGATLAILKERRPSCGVCRVQQDGRQVPGHGVTAEKLAAIGLKLISLDPPKQP